MSSIGITTLQDLMKKENNKDLYRHRGKLIERMPDQHIRALKKGCPEGGYQSYGFDTEFLPATGEPTMLCYSYPNGVDRVDVVTSTDNVLDLFLEWCEELPDKAVVWAHNLEVDLIALLATEPTDYRRHWYKGKTIVLGFPRWRCDISILFGGPVCAEILYPRVRRDRSKPSGTKRVIYKRIYIRDTFAFFKAKLDKIAGDLLGEGKDEIDEELYDIDWRISEDDRRQEFLDYAAKDTNLVRRIGDFICALCSEYDVALPISLPGMAVAKYRKTMVEDYPALGDQLFGFGLNSYYGGRVQTFYKGMVSGSIKKYDLNSAYAYALSVLPDLRNTKWVRTSNLTHWGVYYASVDILVTSLPVSCKLQGYRLSYPVGENIVGYWCGMELAEAEKQGFIHINWLSGWKVEGRYTRPFKSFVAQHWEEKQRAEKGHVMYAFPKLIVNALYGKLLNLIPSRRYVGGRYDGQLVYDPGSFFHPIYAAWITAICRTRILRAQGILGDKLINIQTDGLWTLGEMDTSDDLGKFDYECDATALLTIRGNVYMPFDSEGLPILKRTKLHGFHGKGDSFLDAVHDGSYWVVKWLKRFEANRLGLRANAQLGRRMRFNWNASDYKMQFPPFIDAEHLLSESVTGEPYEYRKGVLRAPKLQQLEMSL